MPAYARAKWLHIPIEIQVRELESRFLLACGAAARGYQVVIGNQPAILCNIDRLPPGIVFEKAISTNRGERLASMSRKGYVIACSDEETPAIYRDSLRFLQERMSDETLSSTMLFCCWSDLQRDLILQAYPNQAHRLSTTGTARTDIWRPEFRDIFAEDVDRIRKNHGRFILFNSNFGHVIHRSGPDYIDRILFDFRLQEHEGFREHMKRMVVDGLANLEIYQETLPKIAEWFPEHKVIIRPHPADDETYWREFSAPFPKIEVRNEGGATAWILASDVVLHHGCGTGTEASLLGKPHVVYAPVPDVVHDEDISSKLAPVARTEAELREILSRTLVGERLGIARAEPLDRYFARLDGRFAFQSILDAFDRLSIVEQWPTKGILRGDLSNRTIGKRMRHFIKGKNTPQKVSDRDGKWRGVSVDHLYDLADRFRAIVPEFPRMKIRPLGEEVFWVSAGAG